MGAVVKDISVITSNVAQRNGLKYFEVVVSNWGLFNPDTNLVGTSGIIGSGRSFSLPKDLPIAGIAIGPLSTIDQVLLTPDYNGFTGITGLVPTALQRAIANPSGGEGNPFTTQVPCSVEAPATAILPGQITIEACRSHYFRQRTELISQFQFVEPNNQLRQIMSSSRLREPVLQLYCFLREPGPAGWPTKRPPYYDYDRQRAIADSDIGADTTVAAWPISGRKKVQLDVWMLPSTGGAGTDNDARGRCRVLLHRGTGPETASNLDWDEPAMLHSEQVYPPATVLPNAQGSSIHIHEELQNAAGPNMFSVIIDDPMATFMELRSSFDSTLGDIYYNLRAVD